jgi:tetratricopeptide (TPR) repeat protein
MKGIRYLLKRDFKVKRETIKNKELKSALLFLLCICSTYLSFCQAAKDFMSMGIERQKKKDYSGSILMFSKAVKLNPKLSEAYFQRGYSKHLQGNNHEAIEDYDLAFDLNTKQHAEFFFYRAEANRAILEYNEAIEDYNIAVGLKPNYLEAYLNMSFVKAKQKSIVPALGDMSKAIRLGADIAIKRMQVFVMELW